MGRGDAACPCCAGASARATLASLLLPVPPPCGPSRPLLICPWGCRGSAVCQLSPSLHSLPQGAGRTGQPKAEPCPEELQGRLPPEAPAPQAPELALKSWCLPDRPAWQPLCRLPPVLRWSKPGGRKMSHKSRQERWPQGGSEGLSRTQAGKVPEGLSRTRGWQGRGRFQRVQAGHGER